MKRWTRHQPRPNHLADVDQFNTEQVAHRGSMASLDRTQLPPVSSHDAFVPKAVHAMWLGEFAEQTEIVGTGVSADQWRCMTTRNYSGQTVDCGTLTLTGHKGGMTYVEWTGAGFVNAMALLPVTAVGNDSSEKRLLLRIVVNGLVVAYSEGLLQGLESFRVFGTAFLPPGDHTLQIQCVGLAAGDLDPLSNEGNTTTIMQYHVVNNKVFVLARYR